MAENQQSPSTALTLEKAERISPTILPLQIMAGNQQSSSTSLENAAENQQSSSTTLENAEEDLPSTILSILQTGCLPSPMSQLSSPLQEALKAFFKLVLPAPPCKKCGERTFFRYFNNTTKTKQLQPRFQCAICALENNSRSSKGHFAEFTVNQATYMDIIEKNSLDIHNLVRSAIVSAPEAQSYVHHLTPSASSQLTSSTKKSSSKKKRRRVKDDYVPPPAVPLQKLCVGVNDQQNYATSDDCVPAPAMPLQKQRTAMNDQRSSTPTLDIPLQKQITATNDQQNAAPTPAVPLRKKQYIAVNDRQNYVPPNDQQNTPSRSVSLQKQCTRKANDGEEYHESYRFGNIIVRRQGASIELHTTSLQIDADELEDRRNRGACIKLHATNPQIDTNEPNDRGTNEPKDRGTRPRPQYILQKPRMQADELEDSGIRRGGPQYILQKPRMQSDELEDSEIRGASIKLRASNPQIDNEEREDRGIRPQFILKKPRMKSGNVISLEICIAGLTRDT